MSRKAKATDTLTQFHAKVQLTQAESYSKRVREDAPTLKRWPLPDQEQYHALQETVSSLVRNKKNKKITDHLNKKIEKYRTYFREKGYTFNDLGVEGCGIEITPPLTFSVSLRQNPNNNVNNLLEKNEEEEMEIIESKKNIDPNKYTSNF